MTTDTEHDDRPRLRVRGPADLAHAVPYLLGFHPSSSLVLVGLAARRVVVTARVDLDELGDPGLLPHTVAALARGGAESLVGIVFDDSAAACAAAGDGPLPWCELADELHATAGQLGVDIDEVALVSARRLWSYDCADPDCCPPAGRPLEQTSEIDAAATYAGLVALPDRASLVDLLAPRADPARAAALCAELAAAETAAIEALVGGGATRQNRSDVRALFAAARASDQPGSDPVDDAQLVRFGAALRRIPVRDAVWLGIDEGRIDGRALWRQLATALPAPFDAAPAFLFGWASYRDGDGALAGIAAERALASDARYSAADMILAALQQAIDPRKLPSLRSSRRQHRVRAAARGARPGAGDRKRR
jgi:hypothetical protein